jgi:hypothetical protein
VLDCANAAVAAKAERAIRVFFMGKGIKVNKKNFVRSGR